jgi:RHS repeat-associated protein
MTRQESPVSGVTTYAYNEHGELVTEIDARGVVVTRAMDVLDRVTTVSYPDPSLTTTYAYDAGTFGKGRLTGLTRHGETIAYAYDRFGRLIQDGSLTYAYDRNGNRTSIGHPEGVTAVYTHDFADREETLSVQIGTTPPFMLVTAADYEPFGPLSSLFLSNGLTETRAFDGRYAPEEIRVDGTGTLLHWSYATDPVGNISAITDLLTSANNRTYGYQDVQYFLTQGNGPWGPRNWTYDRIGNRLTETRGAATDTYAYLTNPSGGSSPKLHSITFGAGGTHTFSYDAAGNTTQVYKSDEVLQLIYDGASRLSTLRSIPEDARTNFAYDGRSYLRRAEGDVDECHPGLTVPTYDSAGLLRRREHRNLFTPAAAPQDSETVLYFAGRPVATLRLTPSGSDLKYLTTDHLGTPILATADTGALVWQGGFEPFGADWSGAAAAGVFLRFPGQWVDGLWEGGEMESGLYYNVHRWYGWGQGRYGRVDPAGRQGDAHPYAYAFSNPLTLFDPLGRRSRVCCRKIPWIPAHHCFIQIEQEGRSTTCALHGGRFTPGEEGGVGQIRRNEGFDDPDESSCGPWNEGCETDQCDIAEARNYSNPSVYNAVVGPNSNTFVGTIARKCGIEKPVDGGWTRGWDNNSPAPLNPRHTPIPSPCKLP